MIENWSLLARRADEDIDLLDAALLIARDEYPELDPAFYRERCRVYAEQIRPQIRPELGAVQAVRLLNRLLFEEEGFAGNLNDYYDPRNSYLNDVFERKLGIPISLAVIYMEVARQLGLPVEGVSFPGHFLLRMPVDDGIIVLDPFHHGRSLDADELRSRAQSHLGDQEVDEGELFSILEPASKRDILMRMLRNLKALYAERQAWDKALRSSDRLITLDPSRVEEYRDRGMLYLRLGHGVAASQDLTHYLSRAPQAADAEQVRQALLSAQGQRSRLN